MTRRGLARWAGGRSVSSSADVGQRRHGARSNDEEPPDGEDLPLLNGFPKAPVLDEDVPAIVGYLAGLRP